MKVFTTIKKLQNHLKNVRIHKKTIGLVPTMGSLHEGHKALIEQSVKENSITVCCIFVNPKQFNNIQDFRRYPRNLQSDLKLLKAWNCDIAFSPSEKQMYPDKETIAAFSFGRVGNILEGRFRPGHFEGVGLVVCKLFNIVMPDKAYFGLKDVQQCFIIQQLVKDLSYNIKLRLLKTVREKNGLAISSRNKRLNEEEKKVASTLFKVLKITEQTIKKTGRIQDALASSRKMLAKNKEIKPEYLEVINLKNFEIIKNLSGKIKIAICIAAFIGEVRLIDNVILTAKG